MRHVIPIDFLITAAVMPPQLGRSEVNRFDVQSLLPLEPGVKLAPWKSISESSSQGCFRIRSIKSSLSLLLLSWQEPDGWRGGEGWRKDAESSPADGLRWVVDISFLEKGGPSVKGSLQSGAWEMRLSGYWSMKNSGEWRIVVARFQNERVKTPVSWMLE